jgi:putative transposase
MALSSFLKRCNRLRWGSGTVLHSTRAPWDNGYIESFNNRLRRECLKRNRWTNLLEARVVIGDFKHEHHHRHDHSALGYRTPAEYASPAFASCASRHLA